MSTQEIRDIYKNIVIQREQTSKHTKDVIKDTLSKQLTRVFDSYWKLLQSPKVSQHDMDEAKRQMSKTLEIFVMDSDHDVIQALTNNVISKQYKDKVLKTLDVSG